MSNDVVGTSDVRHERPATGERRTGTGTGILVDGHVHFHSCFSWERFLDAAAANFAAARRKLRLTDATPGCLLLTESAGVYGFRMLRDRPSVVEPWGWEIAGAADEGSLVLRRSGGETLVVVAGRQIVTRENLEVLALACEEEFPDGMPIPGVLAEVADAGAVPVIPWGFGKWWFRRGRLVRALIERGFPYRFFLGDNGGRPRISASPRLFGLARDYEIPVLPGSDPLPFPDQISRVAAYGFHIGGCVPLACPTQGIRDAVLELNHQPRSFGRRESLPRFARSQIRMQRVTRRRGSRS